YYNRHLKVVLCFFLLLLSFTVSSQVVSGTVIDGSGIPLVGVNIIEKGTNNGVMTDFDGKFSIQVQLGAVLRITSLGYATQELPVGNQTNFDIILVEEASSLDEVVVVGYGVQKKSDLTGAVVSFDAKALEEMPQVDI